MITDSFDPRTMADMEVALERACGQLPEGKNTHSYRKFVARRIIDCAVNEKPSLTRLSQAGYRAVVEVCLREGRARTAGSLPKHLRQPSASRDGTRQDSEIAPVA